MNTEPLTEDDIRMLKLNRYRVTRDGVDWSAVRNDETIARRTTEEEAWKACDEHSQFGVLIDDVTSAIAYARDQYEQGEVENAKFELEHAADTILEEVRQKPLPMDYTLLVRAPDGLEISATGPSMDVLLESLGYVRKKPARAMGSNGPS